MTTGVVRNRFGVEPVLLLLDGCIEAEDASGVGVDKRRPEDEAPELYSGLNATDSGCSANRARATRSATAPCSRRRGRAVHPDPLARRARLLPAHRQLLRRGPGPLRGRLVIAGSWHAPPVDTECSLIFDIYGTRGDVLGRTLLHFPVGPQPEPPAIQASVILHHSNGACRPVTPGQTEIQCDPVLQTDTASMHVEVDWDTAEPGECLLGDSCGGEFDVFFETSAASRHSGTRRPCPPVHARSSWARSRPTTGPNRSISTSR